MSRKTTISGQRQAQLNERLGAVRTAKKVAIGSKDATIARLEAELAEERRVRGMLVEALERIESVCNACARVGAMIHPNGLLEEVEPTLSALRAANLLPTRAEEKEPK